jgi:hypothetical protein
MAKTKAELQNDQAEYDRLHAAALAAVGRVDFDAALDHCIDSLKHVDGMMQFEKRWEKRQFHSVETIDLLLRYAPILQRRDCLDALTTILAADRRIDRLATADLAALLLEADLRFRRVSQLIDFVGEFGNAAREMLAARYGGPPEEWAALSETLEQVHYLTTVHTGDRLELQRRTDISRDASGQCRNCGTVARAPLEDLLGGCVCQSCGVETDLTLCFAEGNSSSDDACST